MRIVLVTGGARAGKSRWAEEEAHRLAPRDVTFIATAEARDEDMARRIAAHRAARPEGWTTVEEPVAVPSALAVASTRVVLLDCLTLWVSNLMLLGDDHEAAVERLLDVARVHEGTLLIVTNEVGLGLVPDNPLGRRFRDTLGWVNARVAREAGAVILMVAGIPVSVR